MGVYVFESVHSSWLKVGHHLVSPRRPNAYYRIAGRGFYSVVHPPELDGKLSFHDFRLRAWYPSLTRSDELKVHRACDSKENVGEFHPSHELDVILKTCEELGGGESVSLSDKERQTAMRWGLRRARKARAKKQKLAKTGAKAT